MEKQKVRQDQRKRPVDDADTEADAEKDQTAYEDSWYRSLKALSERKPEVSHDEDVEAPED